MKKPATIIREILISNSSITDVVGTRIFPVNANNQALPFIVIAAKGGGENDKSSVAMRKFVASVDFMCAVDSYDEGERMYNTIFDILQKTHFDDDGCTVTIDYRDDDEFYSMYYDSQVQRINFNVNY